MEYGIWNFHGGLWPTNNLATFNGTTLTPITAAALPTNTASFAITAGLLNPIITAAAACNLNVFETAATTTTDNTINIDEQNSNDTTNSSKFTEQNNNENENEYDDNEDDATDNEATDDNDDNSGATDNVNLVNSTNSSEFIASDLSSNSYDDNAIDNTIKITNNNQIHGYFAQQYAPVYNLVLGHFNQNPTTISVSETTDESSEDENTTTISTNENFTSTDNDNYTKQNDQQPSSHTTSTSTTVNATSEDQQHPLSTNNTDIQQCPVAGCEYKTVHIEILEQHVASHGEKLSKNKKAANMQRIRYEREEYHCSMCTYTCTTEKAYLRHLRMHSLGETPQGRLSCAVCGRDRIGETAMAKHMRKHRDDRFFCCDICVFRTVQLKKLIQHRRMHTGEKPHLCPHCAYRSARRDNLRSHVRRVHKRDNLWCDTFSPRGMLLTPSTSKTIHKDSDSSPLPPSSETKIKNIEK